jgi:hypothetical protein
VCVHRRRRGAACMYHVNVGSFVRADAAGANSFRFTGRVRGARLAAGSYLLEAVPRGAAGTGAPAYAAFHVIR